jgi:hypothetical protein
MTLSLDNSGLQIDTVASVVSTMTNELRTEFGLDVIVSDTSQVGKLMKVFARQIVSTQQGLLDVSSSLSLDQATGVQLVRLAQLNGTSRIAATRSTIDMRAIGNGGTAIGDKRVRSNDTNAVFRVPLGTVIPASGVVTFTAVADQTGDVQAFAGDTWTIVDQVAGWTGVGALTDYVPGSPQESQEALRGRARQAARANARATEPAVREALAAIPGMVSADGIFNRRPVAFDGVPAFTVEPILDGSFSAQDVGATLYNSLGETTPTFGSTSVSITTPTGGTFTANYTQVETLRIQFRITLDTTGAEVTLDLDYEQRVINAVVAYANSLTRGLNVSPAIAAARAVSALTTGSVMDFTGEARYFNGVFQSTPLVVGSRQRAFTIGGPTAGQTTGTTTEPFNLTSGWALHVSIDGAAPLVYTATTGDYAIISAATADEVAAALSVVLGTVATASNVNGRVSIVSATEGASSSVDILIASTGGFLTALGLSVGISTGTDSDIDVVVIP